MLHYASYCLKEDDPVNAEQRRSQILRLLQSADRPVSAASLAGQLGVSRQIIVGDVALLRAGGADITATPRGYVILRCAGLMRRVAVQHRPDQMEQELNLIVDFGCTVLDVIVDHPVYGQLTGQLDLSSRYDVAEFIHKVSQSRSHPLSDLTEGIHIHTVSCPSETAWQGLRNALEQAGFLLS